jgi:AcrR family transcriptional regulator
VIDAAERLLREGKADFSMRDLAAEAGVSFATPFNQFGSKAAIMHALAERRIDTMAKRFAEQPPLPHAVDRVLLAIGIAAAGMLEEPRVNRAVMGWIGTAGPIPGNALAHSTALWRLALGDGEGLIASRQEEALRELPRQLAFGFRGVLSFWTSGELADEALASSARQVASTLLLGFTDRQRSGGHDS